MDKLKQAKKCSRKSRNERVSQFDRTTIFQQNDVPDQLLNVLNMRQRTSSPQPKQQVQENVKKSEFVRANSNSESDRSNSKKNQPFSAAHRTHAAKFENNDKILTSTDDSAIEYRYALWDATADESDEISFSKGDRIRVISKGASGWWVGELDNGKRGTFPYNYTASESAYKSKIETETVNTTTATQQNGSSPNPGRGKPNARVLQRGLSGKNMHDAVGATAKRGRGRPVSTKIPSGSLRRPLPQPKLS